MKNRFSWFGVFIGAMILWASFGSVPYLLDLLGFISIENVKRVAPFGGMFGAADAFFSGFALVAVIISIQQQRESLELQAEELKLARNEMKVSAEAQRDMAEQQKKAICLEIILPFMDEISSSDMRDSIIVLTTFNRKNRFDDVYGELLRQRESGTLSDAEQSELEIIDKSRRKFVGLFHKMHRLHKTGVVDNEMVKVVLGADHCLILLSIIEPLEAQIRSNYSRDVFEFYCGLYTEDELNLFGAHQERT
ncbi:hypothetical protein AB6E95_18195 [Vibrio splendidus]